MKNLIILCLFILGNISLSLEIALAQTSGCYYNDKYYPSGTRIGNYECTDNGWQKFR